MIKAAAKLIKNEVQQLECDLQKYPEFNSSELSSSYLTPSLNIFLQELISTSEKETKIASIGQIIMQSIRPKTLSQLH